MFGRRRWRPFWLLDGSDNIMSVKLGCTRIEGHEMRVQGPY